MKTQEELEKSIYALFPVRLAFYKGTSFTSKLIKWFTRGEYSHVGILFQDGTVIEAWEPNGVRLSKSLGEVHEPGTVVDIYGLADEVNFDCQREAYYWVQGELGKPYDWAGIFQFLTKGDRSRQECNHPEKWFCSEISMAFMDRASYALLNCDAFKVPPFQLSTSPRLVFQQSIVV